MDLDAIWRASTIEVNFGAEGWGNEPSRRSSGHSERRADNRVPGLDELFLDGSRLPSRGLDNLPSRGDAVFLGSVHERIWSADLEPEDGSYWVYVLQGLDRNEAYVGFTEHHPEERLEGHRRHAVQGSTKMLVHRRMREDGVESWGLLGYWRAGTDKQVALDLERQAIALVVGKGMRVLNDRKVPLEGVKWRLAGRWNELMGE